MDRWFITCGRLEAFSFLALLMIAMPFKYYGGNPMLVRIIGPIHGILFLAYVGLAIMLSGRDEWPTKKLMFAILSSVIPLGTFWFERKYFQPNLLNRQ